MSQLAGHLLVLATLRLLAAQGEQQAATEAGSGGRGSRGGAGTSTTQTVRFSHAKSSACNVLAQLTQRYLELLGKAASESAAQSGRNAVNARDAVEAINGLGGSLQEIQEWCEESGMHIRSNPTTYMLPEDPAAAAAAMASTSSANALGQLMHSYSNGQETQKTPSLIAEYRPLDLDEEAEVLSVLRNPVQQAPVKQKSSAKGKGKGKGRARSSSSASSFSIATPPQLQYEPLVSISDGSDDPMSFLPPLPDLSATLEAVQTIQEDETGRTIKRARRTIEGTGSRATAGSASWHRSIPYEHSTLAQYESSSARPILQKGMNNEDEAALQSALTTATFISPEEAPAESSLLYFLETFNYISLEAAHLAGGPDALPLRHNAKRRRAATAIHSNILNPSDDSLGGAIPTPQPRQAKKQAGWIPFPPLLDRDDPSDPSGKLLQPFPQLHPFSTALPTSITDALPNLPLPHSSKNYAPIQHPRIPTLHSSIRTILETSSNLNGQLFNRTTRLGPPGPLLENGASGSYAVELEKPNIIGWYGDTPPRMMSWNFDWEIGNETEEPPSLKSQNQATPSTSVPPPGDGRASAGPSNGPTQATEEASAGARATASADANATVPAPVAAPAPVEEQRQKSITPVIIPPTPSATTAPAYVGPAFPQLPSRQAGHGHTRQISLVISGGGGSTEQAALNHSISSSIGQRPELEPATTSFTVTLPSLSASAQSVSQMDAGASYTTVNELQTPLPHQHAIQSDLIQPPFVQDNIQDMLVDKHSHAHHASNNNNEVEHFGEGYFDGFVEVDTQNPGQSSALDSHTGAPVHHTSAFEVNGTEGVPDNYPPDPYGQQDPSVDAKEVHRPDERMDVDVSMTSEGAYNYPPDPYGQNEHSANGTATAQNGDVAAHQADPALPGEGTKVINNTNGEQDGDADEELFSGGWDVVEAMESGVPPGF